MQALQLPSSSDAVTWLKRYGILLATAPLVCTVFHLRRKKVTGGAAQYTEGHWLLQMLPTVSEAVKSNTLHQVLLGLHKKYGKTIVLCLPLQPAIVDSTDPKNVEHVLKGNFANYEKGVWFRNRLTDLLGDGIFNIDGPMWHSQRKVSSHMFTQNQFKNHIWRVVQQNCGRVVDILRGVKDGEVVDMFNLMNRFTLDTIGQVGFARDIGSLTNADSPFLKSFDRAQQISVLRFFFPFWRVTRLLGIGSEWDAKQHFQVLSAYSYETVRLLKEDPSGEKGDSFVGMFVNDAKKSGTEYSDKFLRDMVLNFLIAGRDTTAQAMSWILWLVMQHPAVEEKMVAEIKAVLGDGPITYENGAQLKYVQNVINEGLRLYPSVPIDNKIALSDDTLPDGTFIPAGTVVGYNAFSMGRDKDLWGEDAELFKPERWEGREMPSSFVYTAFNAGPRECLGKRLAWVEMRACLAEVLRNVRLRLAVPADSIKQDVQLTIGMSTGLPCYVSRR